MKKLLKNILRNLSLTVLVRYQPTVVAVTGSIGKTSTTRAIAAVLSREFSVGSSPKNFNNELGVPLSILGAKKSGGSSPLAWLKILSAGAKLAYGKDQEYPEILVLEMGADHPGDLAYLTSFVKPDISVVTAVSVAHTEFFGNIENVAIEKVTIVEALDSDGVAILNNDDEHVSAMGNKTQARTVSFGFSERSDFGADEISFESAMGTFFTRFDLKIGDWVKSVNLSESVGIGNVYAALAAAATAIVLGMDKEMLAYGLADYQPPPGRLRIIKGIKDTVLIDDTYNSSPRAAAMALEVFGRLNPEAGGRRIAVLGDMLELGADTQELHKIVGKKVSKANIDILICVGPLSNSICNGALESGMSENMVFHFDNSVEAGKFLQDRLKSGDIALIKGSQGVRMEKIVKELMAEPERAGELLVRQGVGWG